MNLTSQAPLILITGGGRGIGAATASLAAERGYDVAISFVSNEEVALAVVADVAALGRRALPVCADSADPDQVIRLFAAIDQTFGRICMPAAENPTGLIGLKTQSLWDEEVTRKRLHERSYGWRAQRLPSLPERSSMLPEANKQGLS